MTEVALFIDLENITTGLWNNFQQAPDCASWVEKARSYIAVQRALDEIESAALLGGSR